MLCLAFEEVSVERIRKIGPDVVFTVLASSSFDIIDLCCVLFRAEYPGQCIVYCGDAPDTAMIASEIEAAAPGLDLKMVSNADLSEPDSEPEPEPEPDSDPGTGKGRSG